MFVGHYSAAFAATALPKAPKLGTLFVAAQLVDIAFFSFLPSASNICAWHRAQR